MTPRRRLSPATRRAQLVTAALTCFRSQGVAGTAISDIVRAAGVAQGTFYLYFDSKDDIVFAVAAEAVEALYGRIAEAVDMPDANALDKLLELKRALLEMSDEPHEIELAELLHSPQNRDVHDRVTEGFAQRIHPLMTAIVAQGIEEGVFDVADPSTAAWFVTGAFQGYEAGVGEPSSVAPALDQLAAFVLRGLGYTGPLPAPSA